MSYNQYGGGGGGSGGGYPPPQYTDYKSAHPQYGNQQSGTSNLGYRRNQQIQSIFIAYPNHARAVKNDNSVIDVAISLRNNNRVTFRLMLGPNFPIRPPTIRLLAVCSQYTYLDQSTSNVVHASLQRWDPNCNLGQLCKQIFNQFVNFPPTVLQNNVDPTSTSQVKPQPQPAISPTTTGFNTDNTSYFPSTTTPSSTTNTTNLPLEKIDVKIPSIPKTFRQVESMGRNEVDDLLNSSSRLEEFVENLEYLQELSVRVDSMRTENVNIAKRNKEREYEIKRKTDLLNQKKIEVQNLSKIVQDVNQKRIQISNRYKPKQIVQMLSKLMIEGEKGFTKKAERFSEDGGNVQEFIKGMKKERHLYHIRKLKKEGFETKFAHQM